MVVCLPAAVAPDLALALAAALAAAPLALAFAFALVVRVGDERGGVAGVVVVVGALALDRGVGLEPGDVERAHTLVDSVVVAMHAPVLDSIIGIKGRYKLGAERGGWKLFRPCIEHVPADALASLGLLEPHALEVRSSHHVGLDGDSLVGAKLPVADLVALLVCADQPLGGDAAGGSLVEELVQKVARFVVLEPRVDV